MKERTAILEEAIVKLVEAKKYTSLRDFLATLNPADIASALGAVADQALPLVFRLLPKELAAETFVEMEPEQQETLIKGFSDLELKAVVEELYVDDAVDLVEEMPANVVSRILAQADPDTRKMINEILKYPEDSAGSVMTTEFVELRANMTAAQAIQHIRKVAVDKETINTCYVTDGTHHLQGVLSIGALILADRDTLCQEIMNVNVISVQTLEDQEAVARMLSKYNFGALPVVDGDGRLVGIVTVDDAMDIMEAEATEDIEKMAAITPSDRPYLSTGPITIWKRRIPWLLLLMISATFTGLIITKFEDALASCAVLIAYIPMLMDTGGNSGSQASVTIIRGLSLQELQFRDLLRVVWKEFRVAILCGVTLAACNFVKLLLLDRVGMAVAATVCVTLMLTIVVAKLVGCTLPMLAKKLGFDPAVMASPFITTIVDVLSLLLYFQLSSTILGL
ncbi:MAG: magnesium transporter [Candidatus Avoscillospira sp.]